MYMLIIVNEERVIILLFFRDFTAKKALERSKMCDIPFVWDDPNDKDDVKFTVQALFNQVNFHFI